MLTVSVTTLRTGAFELPAPETVADGDGIKTGDTVGCVRSGKGTGAGVTCTGTVAGAGTGGGVLGLFREGAGLASGAGTTLLMTLSTKERKGKVKAEHLSQTKYFKMLSQSNFLL